jgi:outer membrane protein
MNKISVIVLALLMSAATGYAQKFGYCNSDQLLSQIPEVKAADSELQAFQTQLSKRGQERVKSLQEAAADLERKKEQGVISGKDYETQAAKLRTEQDAIQKYQQEVYAMVTKKREELFKPLIDKVNKAMEDVGNANGFSLVFDASSRIVLYADPSLDVTKLVKIKLGLAN